MKNRVNLSVELNKELDNIKVLLRFYVAITESLVKSEANLEKRLEELRKELNAAGRN